MIGSRTTPKELDGLEIPGSRSTLSFAFIGDTWSRSLRFLQGKLSARPASSGLTCDNAGLGEPDFVLTGSDAVWAQLLMPSPKPGTQGIFHLLATGHIILSGDQKVFDQHVHLVQQIIDTLRADRTAHRAVSETMPQPSPPSPSFVPARTLDARGEYIRVSSAVGTADIHVERCGSGPPLVAFATAGSSSTQWHGLMTESDLTDRYELITIDLPWHGSSSPTFGVPVGGWSLNPGSYSRFIRDAIEAVGLDTPLMIGVSMAGAAVVHAIAHFPDRFAGAIACQVGPRVRNRLVPQLESAEIDQSQFVPEWTYGLMNPASPREFRKRVWWGYSSGGYRLYAADIMSYQQWDIDEVQHLLTTDSPHIAILSGSYDTSVPPQASRELAESIPNSSFQEMPELGHFPHAENPAMFAAYLEPAIQRILGTGSSPHPSR